MYLSNDEIVEVIIEHFKNSILKQAIMIDGEWGSGKTHFVKHQLIPKLKNEFIQNQNESSSSNYKVLYISLYGFESCSQIYEAIYGEFVNSKLEKMGNNKFLVSSGIQVLSKLISTGLSAVNIDTEKLPKLEDLLCLDNMILIFDDLERCIIEVNQVFGCINSLVEHSNTNVVIVGNQNEIGKLTYVEDLPHKYNISLNNNLKFKDKHSDDEANKDNAKVSFEELKKRSKLLFPNDILYEEIKEKLIGIIIKYRGNLKRTLPLLITENFTSSGVGNYLKNQEEFITRLFSEYEHYNFRTVIFALESFSKITEAIPNLTNEHDPFIDDEKKKILEYIIRLSIYLKSGDKGYDWNDSSQKYGMIYLSGNFYNGDKVFGYKFIDDYLLSRYFDKTEIAKQLKEIITKNRIEKKEKLSLQEEKDEIDNLTYNQIIPWYMHEDNVLQNSLKNIYEELSQFLYPPEYFKEIIIMLMQMDHQGFDDINYEKYTDKIGEYIETNFKETDNLNWDVLSTDSEFTKKYNEIIEPLKEIEKNIKKTEKDSLDYIISSGDGWGHEFQEYCKDKKDDFFYNQEFIKNIDIDNLIEVMKKSKLADLYKFLNAIDLVYSFRNLEDCFSSDIISLKELLEKLDNSSMYENSVTRKIYFDKLIYKLKHI